MRATRHIPSVDELRGLLRPALEASPALCAIVFGSVATGRATEYSDVDLIIVAETEAPFHQRPLDYGAVTAAVPCGIDLIVYTPKGLERLMYEGRGFQCQALAEGVVVYARPGTKLPPTFAYDARRHKLEYRGMVHYDPVREARRWLGDAREELTTARLTLTGGAYPATCFHSQQACEKALKALALLHGDRQVRGHSLEDFVGDLKRAYSGLAQFEAVLTKMSLYYVTTRYPDALQQDEIPSDRYKRPHAEEALDAAERVVGFAEGELGKARGP